MVIDLFLENPVYDIENEQALEVITGDEGAITCRQKRSRRGVYNLVSWLEAYENYTRIMANFHGMNIFNKLSAYKSAIIDYDRMFLWKAVQRYDMKHRSKKGGRSIDFQDIDILLASVTLNSSVLKVDATRCNDCGAYEHIWSACPFRDMPGTQSRGVGRPPAHYSSNRYTTEKCFNWNSERCHDSQCSRLHVCRGCGGNLPYKQCSEHGPCSTNPEQTRTTQATSNFKQQGPPHQAYTRY